MVLDLQLDPVLVRWGAFVITSNGVCTALALLVGTWFALRALERAGVGQNNAGKIACGVLLGGFAGSRAVFMLAHASYYAGVPRDLWLVGDGSGSLVGALGGGAAALWLAARACGVERRTVFDAAVPAAFLCIPLHLIGNLLTGAGYGPPTGGAWGVIYWHPDALVPLDLISVPLHPLPLYQIMVSLGTLTLWTVLHNCAAPVWLGQEVR